MPDIQTLGPWVERFLLEYIVTERNLSRNTQKSYRDTFNLLLPFVGTKLRKPIDRLVVRDVTSKMVLAFLAHLEDGRSCSVRTRNTRLAAIRALARFIASRETAHVGWCGHIRSISSKKATQRPIVALTKTEAEAILDVPDRMTLRGRTEYAVLLFLYNTGARVSEAVQLRVGDVQLGDRDGRHALVTLHGKGGKIRQCPLLPNTERVLAELLRGRTAGDALFRSKYRKPYTRFGIYRLVERCAMQVPRLAGRRITPHLLRHTTACELVRAKVDINTIRAWLGHASLDATNIYAEIDLKMKADALALCDMASPESGRPWKEHKGIMAFLKTL